MSVLVAVWPNGVGQLVQVVVEEEVDPRQIVGGKCRNGIHYSRRRVRLDAEQISDSPRDRMRATVQSTRDGSKRRLTTFRDRSRSDQEVTSACLRAAEFVSCEHAIVDVGVVGAGEQSLAGRDQIVLVVDDLG